METGAEAETVEVMEKSPCGEHDHVILCCTEITEITERYKIANCYAVFTDLLSSE